MKVVINNCYGGFGLSDEAERKLYEKGSKMVEACDPKEYYGEREDWEKKFEEDKKRTGIFGMNVVDGKILHTNNHDEEFRSDPQLVAVVEELGEKANGECAELKIVEIPDDVEWTIEEYDGNEWVAEKHRTWHGDVDEG